MVLTASDDKTAKRSAYFESLSGERESRFFNGLGGRINHKKIGGKCEKLATHFCCKSAIDHGPGHV
jgi:hypothetical protein